MPKYSRGSGESMTSIRGHLLIAQVAVGRDIIMQDHVGAET